MVNINGAGAGGGGVVFIAVLISLFSVIEFYIKRASKSVQLLINLWCRAG